MEISIQFISEKINEYGEINIDKYKKNFGNYEKINMRNGNIDKWIYKVCIKTKFLNCSI